MIKLDEILYQYAVSEGFEGYMNYCDSLTLSDGEWMDICRVYAKQVAEQALKDAAENATYITVGDEISIVKSSITKTKIELP